MSILSKYENPNINKKETFLLWIKLGSLEKVSLYLEKQGVFSLKTHKRYDAVILSRYAWRYALENPEEAYQEILNNGSDMSPEYWEQLLVRKAYSVFVNMGKNRKNFYTWLENNNLEKYKNYKSKAEFFREDGDLQTIQEQVSTPS